MMSNGVSQSATVRNRVLVHHEECNYGQQNDRTNYLPLIHGVRESAQRPA